MKYVTEYKSREIRILPAPDGTYRATRILGSSIRRSSRHYPNAASALKEAKELVDGNQVPLHDPCVVFGW